MHRLLAESEASGVFAPSVTVVLSNIFAIVPALLLQALRAKMVFPVTKMFFIPPSSKMVPPFPFLEGTFRKRLVELVSEVAVLWSGSWRKCKEILPSAILSVRQTISPRRYPFVAKK